MKNQIPPQTVCLYRNERRCRVLRYDKKRKQYRINRAPGWAKPDELKIIQINLNHENE